MIFKVDILLTSIGTFPTEAQRTSQNITGRDKAMPLCCTCTTSDRHSKYHSRSMAKVKIDTYASESLPTPYIRISYLVSTSDVLSLGGLDNICKKISSFDSGIRHVMPII